MTFTHLSFLFFLLPVTVLLSFVVPVRFRNAFLLLASLLFYSWGSLRDLVLLLLYTGLHYAAGRALAETRRTVDRYAADEESETPSHLQRSAAYLGVTRRILILMVVVDVALLALYKYTFLVMPLGLSFYTFTALSYLFDVYRGEEALKNPLDLLLYFSFFPKVVSGPIVPYHEIRRQLRHRAVNRERVVEGLMLFFLGLFKKVLLADALGRSFQHLYAQGKLAALTALLGMVLYSLQLYFDFSGYSDMAIGLARVFGFRFHRNFDYPYLSRSLSEFWRRWHISLGQWFKQYVYIPLGGNREGEARTTRNLLIVWALTGLWHGNTLAFLFWGLYHGVLLLLEKNVFSSLRERLPAAVQILLTDLLVMIGWIFFFSPTLASGLQYIAKFVGADGLGIANGATFFYLRENLLLLVISVLCCGPFLKSLQDQFLLRRGRPALFVAMGVYALLFLFTIAALIGSTNTSFLYAQF